MKKKEIDDSSVIFGFLSFIPFIGVIFAILALSFAIRQEKKKKNNPSSEIAVVLASVGLVAQLLLAVYVLILY
jgi:hypothetical protein